MNNQPNRAELLKIRDRVDLRVQVGEQDSVFAVRVQDISDEGIYLDRPIIDRSYFPSVEGLEVEISYQRADATYRFRSAVLKQGYLGRLPVLLVEHPKELERIQRRQYFRLDIEIPIIFRADDGDTEGKPSEFNRGIMLDLSAGGVKFRTMSTRISGINPGGRILVSFSLSREMRIVDAACQVLTIRNDEGDPREVNIVCRFTNLPDRLREAIVIHNIRTQQRYRQLKLR